ncbi:MAG: carbon storage regulator CsrA [Armatimonadetes bacterium]|nr:carbon storage regulator CsrA [Armatimonadota bacterium]
MLVLSRQIEQDIVIGDGVRIKVVAVSGNQVRLGIEAPAEITILRGELYDEIARQNQAAAEGALGVVKALARPRKS